MSEQHTWPGRHKRPPGSPGSPWSYNKLLGLWRKQEPKQRQRRRQGCDQIQWPEMMAPEPIIDPLRLSAANLGRDLVDKLSVEANIYGSLSAPVEQGQAKGLAQATSGQPATRNSSDHRLPQQTASSGACRTSERGRGESSSLSRPLNATKIPIVIRRPPSRFLATVAANRLLLCALLPLLALLLCAPASRLGYQLTNNMIANNSPPKFTTASGAPSGPASGNSEIVVRVKEGPQSIGKLIYTLHAEDPDEDPLTFGVLGSMASELLRIENTPGNQANVYLRRELDRETTESHQVVITLTDGKLGKGNWVSGRARARWRPLPALAWKFATKN